MFADFGTALDWTEFESDITTGPPNAYTKLYVAPEVSCYCSPGYKAYSIAQVAQQQPRDTSSDVWSLGCIFIEMAVSRFILPGNIADTHLNADHTCRFIPS